MGAWGPGLFSDDVACDVKEYYMNCLREQMSAKEAEDSVAENFEEYLSDEDDGPVVILALADTQWRVGRLSEAVKRMAIDIIDTEKGMGLWKEEGGIALKKRREVLKKLKEKLLSPQLPEKKICRYRIYKCEWKIGDVYAYRFEGELAKEKNYYGKYLLIQKVGEGEWYPGHIVPLVYFRITNDTSLPSIGEVKDIEYIKLAVGERNPNIIYEYRGKLLNTSKRVIPKSLTYLGNTDVIYPESEFIPKHDVSYPYFEWKRIEGKIIRRNEKRKQ